MKKIVVLLCVMLMGLSASAMDYLGDTEVVNITRLAKQVEQAHAIGYKLISANGLKRAPIFVYPASKVVNAESQHFSKKVTIYTGILPYLSNDDELSYVLAHELSHSQEAYDGALKVLAMHANSKRYEYKADLEGIDYMVKAGYNPIAAIIAADKIFGEPMMDWVSTHPKGSKRALAMYKYIYIKYPQYLNSPMTSNIVYRNFLNAQNKEIQKFQQQYKQRRNEAL